MTTRTQRNVRLSTFHAHSNPKGLYNPLILFLGILTMSQDGTSAWLQESSHKRRALKHSLCPVRQIGSQTKTGSSVRQKPYNAKFNPVPSPCGNTYRENRYLISLVWLILSRTGSSAGCIGKTRTGVGNGSEHPTSTLPANDGCLPGHFAVWDNCTVGWNNTIWWRVLTYCVSFKLLFVLYLKFYGVKYIAQYWIFILHVNTVPIFLYS